METPGVALANPGEEVIYLFLCYYLCMWNKINRKNLIIILLFVVIAILSYKIIILRLDYFNTINNKEIVQITGGIKYRVIPNEDRPYKIIIGDIIGIDKKVYDFVNNYSASPNESLLLISGIQKHYSEITNNNFLSLIANENNVLIPGNFCLKNWPAEINKDIYNNSQISHRPFCNSEAETQVIDKLIKQYQSEKIEIYYSSETYKELIQGFLLYLDELNIPYELIKVK